MDMAYVQLLAKGNKGVKFLVALRELLDRTVDSEGMKTRDCK